MVRLRVALRVVRDCGVSGKKTANDAFGPALKPHTHVARYLRHRVLSLYTLPLKLLDV